MPNIPDKNPSDITFEDVQEMGVSEGFYVLGQLRCHELTTEVKVGQLCAALGIAPVEPNIGQIIHEVRGKIIRLEQERRDGSAFQRCFSKCNVDQMGEAVFGYSNGFHTALGQLAKMITLSHIHEND